MVFGGDDHTFRGQGIGRSKFQIYIHPLYNESNSTDNIDINIWNNSTSYDFGIIELKQSFELEIHENRFVLNTICLPLYDKP